MIAKTLKFLKEAFSPVKIAKIPDGEMFWAKNCIKLANYLEAKPETAHDQSTWAEPNSGAPCGTRACALGWAALSGLLPGLQYCIKGRTLGEEDVIYLDAFPSKKEMQKANLVAVHFEAVINGERAECWESAGRRYFGDQVLDLVFLNTTRDKAGTVEALRYCAKQYKKGNTWIDIYELEKHLSENA